MPDVCGSASCVADSIIGRLILPLASLVTRHVILCYLSQTASVLRRSLLTAVDIDVFSSTKCLVQWNTQTTYHDSATREVSLHCTCPLLEITFNLRTFVPNTKDVYSLFNDTTISSGCVMSNDALNNCSLQVTVYYKRRVTWEERTGKLSWPDSM